VKKYYHSTPLDILIRTGLVSLAEEFIGSEVLDLGVDDEESRTALHLAAERGYVTVVRLLLKKGADVKKEQRVTKSAHRRRRARSANITTASTTLHLATKNGHETVAKLLLIHGASPNAKEADEEYHKIILMVGYL